MTKRMGAAVAAAIFGYSCISGCASSSPAYESAAPATRAARLGPTASELETPLAANGAANVNGSAGQREAVTRSRSASAPLEETATIETRRLHGYSFPGSGGGTPGPLPESAPATVVTELPTPVLGQDGQRFTALEERLNQLEGLVREQPEELARRVREMEARVAGLEQRPVEEISGPPAELAAHYEALSARLAELEARPTLTPETPEEFLERIQQMENQLAVLEQRPAGIVQTHPEDMEARFNELSAKLAALEARPAEITPFPDYLAQRIEATEVRLEELETRPAAASPASSTSAAYDAPVSYALHTEYRLGPGDSLEFICFNDPDLSRETVLVRYDGSISLPGIPDVPVAEISRQAAEARVEAAYRSVFRNPRVSLMVREALSRSFTVVGDVSQPGMYPYTQPVRLIEAIGLAGGLRDRSASAGSGGGLVGITGQLVKAFVIRNMHGERQVLEYDLRSLGRSGSHGSEAVILPGDIIYIPEGVNLVYLLGEAENRVVELTEGMTMLQLISLAGGFNSSTAYMRRVVLMREVDETYSEVMLVNVRAMLTNRNLDIRLQPGDIVYIPRRPLVRLEDFIGRFTGTVSPVLGMYNDYITARYSKRISERLLREDNSVLQTLSGVTAASQQVLDIIGR